MLVQPNNYENQGQRNKDRRKGFFHRRHNRGPTVTHSEKGLPQVSRTFGKLNRYTIVMLNIAYLRAHFEHECMDSMREHQLDALHQEAVYDYLVMHAFKDACIELDYRIQMSGMYRHDIYDLIYADHKTVWVRAMKTLITSQGISFLKNDTPKMIVTGETMILARSFNAVI